MQANPNQRQPQAQQCPACGGDPMRGRKKSEPACPVCHGGMSDSPAGKSAMSQAAKMGAQRLRQAQAQRQQAGAQMQARDQLQRRAIAGRPGMGGPGPGAPQGQPQIDPRVLATLAARLGGR